MKKALLIGLLALAVLISGCTSGTNQLQTPPKPTSTPPPTTVQVENIDFSFYPSEVVIARGGTVTWKQKDYDQHTVTGNGFDSGKLSQGQTFSHTFNEAGTFDYWCKIHPPMRAKVIVR